MSLTGNSISIKFTPFGRILKEQDRTQGTEESGGGSQMLEDMALNQEPSLIPPCIVLAFLRQAQFPHMFTAL